MFSDVRGPTAMGASSERRGGVIGSALAVCLAGLTLLTGGLPTRADEPAELEAEARAFLLDTFDVISRIQTSTEHGPKEKHALLETLLSDRLDMASMAAAALGPRIETFSRTEFGEFVQEYARYLSFIYIREIAWSDPSEPVVIVNSRLDARTGRVTLATRAAMRQSVANRPEGLRNRANFESEYSLRERRGSWRILRIRMNAIDMNQAFGAQFESLLRRSSVAELLETLRQHNDRDDGRTPLR